MLSLLALAWLPVAHAGYGDASNGYPLPEERVVHVWTNAVRVDPAAWVDEYLEGGCTYGTDFNEDERTAKDPVLLSGDLNRAARFHSDDMKDNQFFSHTSSDGTSMGLRLSRYWSNPMVAENIARGSSPRHAVTRSWMCSTTGHRANIMNGDWGVLGVGFADTDSSSDYDNLFTQNFSVFDDAPFVGVVMAAHERDEGGGTRISASVFGPDAQQPDDVVAVVGGVATEMGLRAGEGWRGHYEAVVASGDGECRPYYVEASFNGAIKRFPEQGSYGWGDCDWDDVDAEWLDEQAEWDLDDGPSAAELLTLYRRTDCSALPVGAGLGWAGMGLVLALARRRRA